jgi:hypothetical protein
MTLGIFWKNSSDADLLREIIGFAAQRLVRLKNLAESTRMSA